MKFLLTSAGVKNKSIENTLLELCEKPFSQINFLYIMTAGNIEFGDKYWLLDNLKEFRNLNFKQIEVTDIAIPQKDIFLDKIREADVVCFGGGNTGYLYKYFKENGLVENFNNIFQNKIYMGISAGSMIVTNWDAGEGEHKTCQDYSVITDLKNSKPPILDFTFIPHMNSRSFLEYSEENLKKYYANKNEKVYAVDDHSAIKIVNDKIEAISEGKWLEIN